ncbi:hypothetical protein Tco_0976052 [Tanacetum coccineum]|uniref:Uncharacterized protein n=1 Tax=Tanacetum coccineum TaxID=301880 RepID=A0ABQ5EG81_9ASTR
MPTEMELTLEQTQQGVSYEVSSLRIILMILPEHQSEFIHNEMEFLLEPHLNKAHGRSILTDPKVSPTNPGRMTKPYLSPRFIANCLMQNSMSNVGPEVARSHVGKIQDGVEIVHWLDDSRC